MKACGTIRTRRPVREQQIAEIRWIRILETLLPIPRVPRFACQGTCRQRSVITSQLVDDGVDLVLGMFLERGHTGVTGNREVGWGGGRNVRRLLTIPSLFYICHGHCFVHPGSLQRGTGFSRQASLRSLHVDCVSERPPFLTKAPYRVTACEGHVPKAPNVSGLR